MENLYNQTNLLILQTQQTFRSLESDISNAIQIEEEIQEKINTINSNCEKLDVYLFKIPLDQRQNVKMRCDQLKYDSRHLQAALAVAKQKRARREAAANEREQLFHRKFEPNPDITTINMDYAIQHQSSLQNSHRGVDEMLNTGMNALESLRTQRLTLKGARTKLLDMASTLGLSNHTIKLIEKRTSEDKLIMFGGMVVTVIIVFLLVIYFT